MGLRITTWNVNGIRNPFGYQPWRDKRSFAAMFDILEADIVVFQETKIQRKDLTDDMVLVPGWDCYFSLPRHKKGYSGVVIFTRQSVCAPVRAEEGITGILCPPSSSQSFSELPGHQQIGGYPTPAQLAASAVDAPTLDSEGRCVILEFPAFVLLGVYSPANRDETRDDFRLGFLDVLDARIRNLVSQGKRVFLTGDLNISREELDAANAESSMRKQGLTDMQFVSTPARRLFNQLLEGGKTFGDRDEGREYPVMWDICRAFHPDRKGMYTCWEQKVNARPGNCGARIDYVLCSLAMKDWFVDSNIQEGLMGSDHCPVYAIMMDKVTIDGEERYLQDVMNPQGMFVNGIRQRDYSIANDLLPTSGKLIPEFSGRRNIRDMFSRKPSLQQSQSISGASKQPDKPSAAQDSMSQGSMQDLTQEDQSVAAQSISVSSIAASTTSQSPPPGTAKKRTAPEASAPKVSKRSKSTPTIAAPSTSSKGQRTLQGFFKSRPSAPEDNVNAVGDSDTHEAASSMKPNVSDVHKSSILSLQESRADESTSVHPTIVGSTTSDAFIQQSDGGTERVQSPPSPLDRRGIAEDGESVHDPIETKESWSKVFTKRVKPRCEGHDEPCISLQTKKPGMNNGRSFWMCGRPLGPSGAKEKNTQWRCQTFIWDREWNPNAANGS